MESIFRDWHTINFPVIAFIIIVTGIAVTVARRLVPVLASHLPLRFRHSVLPLTSLLRFTIYLLMIWHVVPLMMEPTRERMIALVGASALAVGFAVKDYASSLVAGAVAMAERIYRLGDRVQIGEIYGEVRAINLRSVKIVTPDDTAVSIPHSEIWNTAIHNANDGAQTMLCVAHFHLHAEHDGAAVQRKLVDVAITSPYVDLDQPVSVIAAEKPWGTHYKLKAYVLDNSEEVSFVTDLTLRAKASLARIGVKPSQAMVVTTWSGS